MNRSSSQTWAAVAGFLIGAVLLALMSYLHRINFGDRPLMVLGFIAPALAGGLIGVGLAIVIFRLKAETGQRLDRERARRGGDRIMRSLNRAADIMLRSRDWSRGVQGLLDVVGRAAEAERVIVLRNLQDGASDSDNRPILAETVMDWTSPGLVATADGQELRELDFRAAGLSRWEDYLAQGQLVSGAVDDLPGDEARFLSSHRAGVVALAPIRVDGQWWGVLWFSRSGDSEPWSTAEGTALIAAGDLLGANIARRRLDRAVQKADSRFLTVLEGLDANVYVADMDTYEILYANSRLSTRFGDNMVGQTCWRALQKDMEGPCPFCTNDRLVDEDGRPTGIVSWEFRNTLTGRWNDIKDRAIDWIDGRVVRMEISQDITDRKKAEARRETLEYELRQSQKMEAVGTLAGGVAHEFNNILAAVMGYSELALARNADGEDCSEELTKVINSSTRARNLVRQLLTFSRRENSGHQPLALARVVESHVNMIRQTIPRMIDIKVDQGGDLKMVMGSAEQLEQVLMNLVANAADAMPEGGRLTIATRNVTVSREVCSMCGEEFSGRFVRLSVTDTGHGMEPETLDQVFTPFFTTKEVGQGTGLGMPMVMGLISGHHGHATCTSEPGRGTGFHVYLPALESGRAGELSDAEPAPAPPPADEGRWTGSETLLLVDDEPALRDIGRRFLAPAGYRVLEAASGEEALDIRADRGEEIDLVILDISMPGMGGRRCLVELLRSDPELKVLIASGYARNGSLEEVAVLGAAGFIAKPFSRDRMLETVRRELDREREPASTT